MRPGSLGIVNLHKNAILKHKKNSFTEDVLSNCCVRNEKDLAPDFNLVIK